MSTMYIGRQHCHHRTPLQSLTSRPYQEKEGVSDLDELVRSGSGYQELIRCPSDRTCPIGFFGLCGLAVVSDSDKYVFAETALMSGEPGWLEGNVRFSTRHQLPDAEPRQLRDREFCRSPCQTQNDADRSAARAHRCRERYSPQVAVEMGVVNAAGADSD